MKSCHKHIPQRSCVACRSTQAKRELVRLVRTAQGSVEVDPAGRKAGRGAYLCPAAECWEAGINRGRLEHALRTNISPENREELIRYSSQFIEELTGGQSK